MFCQLALHIYIPSVHIHLGRICEAWAVARIVDALLYDVSEETSANGKAIRVVKHRYIAAWLINKLRIISVFPAIQLRGSFRRREKRDRRTVSKGGRSEAENRTREGDHCS